MSNSSGSSSVVTIESEGEVWPQDNIAPPLFVWNAGVGLEDILPPEGALSDSDPEEVVSSAENSMGVLTSVDTGDAAIAITDQEPLEPELENAVAEPIVEVEEEPVLPSPEPSEPEEYDPANPMDVEPPLSESHGFSGNSWAQGAQWNSHLWGSPGWVTDYGNGDISMSEEIPNPVSPEPEESSKVLEVVILSSSVSVVEISSDTSRGDETMEGSVSSLSAPSIKTERHSDDEEMESVGSNSDSEEED